MATAVSRKDQVERLQARMKYIALSPTCRSSQVLTPRDLTRITIDDRHYGQYQQSLRENTPRHLYSIPGGKIPPYGDRVAFSSQRDLPVKQFYTNTSLHRSRVRQTDELTPKPFSSHGVIDKEVNLPFPAEHPFTSHIPHFAVIPNTSTQDETEPTAKNISTDTSYPVFVKEKASDNWSRREEVNVSSRVHQGTIPVWDYPRSKRHQRCYTYPAPKQLYLFESQRQTGRFSVRPYTTQGLDRINRLTYHATSYQSHFPGYWFQPDDIANDGVQNVLILDDQVNPDNVDETDEFDFDTQNNVNNCDKQVGGEEQLTGGEEATKIDKEESTEPPLELEVEGDESDSIPSAPHLDTMDQDLQDMYHLARNAKISPTKPYMSIDSQHRLYRVTLVPDSQLPGSSRRKQPASSSNAAADKPAFNPTPFSPRTAIASRRLMSAYEFDRSAVKRKFREQYPENAPDLRENSTQGKRHLIHGRHAYFFH